ncbi:MAG: hypothetical protein LBG19_10035, partial [Prevotellaceae bacterium]|nr:hypothetical protein [Prevotellaceae bacterium]
MRRTLARSAGQATCFGDARAAGTGFTLRSRGADRIDGIESFRGPREVRSAKLRGVRKVRFTRASTSASLAIVAETKIFT